MKGGGLRARARAALGVAAGALAFVGALSGCTAARNTLGTSSSPCFRAVPVASEAVHDRGTLAGVRLLSSRDLDKRPKLRAVLSTRAGQQVRTVCAIAYTGVFRVGEVQDPIGHGPMGGEGTFAVVCVSTPQNQLLGTIVLSRSPLPFRHNVLRAPPTTHEEPPGPV